MPPEVRTKEVIVRVILAIPPAVLLWALVLNPANTFPSWRLFCIELLFGILILYITRNWQRTQDPLKLLLAIFVFTFFYLRPATLIFFPNSAVLNRHHVAIEMVESVFAYVAIGTWALFWGVSAGQAICALPRREKIPVIKCESTGRFILAFGVWSIPLLIGFSAAYACSPVLWLKYFQLFNDPTLWLMYSLGVLLSLFSFRSLKAPAFLGIMVVFCFIGLRVMSGSRGATYQLLIGVLSLYLSIGLIRFDQVQVLPTRSKLVMGSAVLALCALMIATFSAGDYMRQTLIRSCSQITDYKAESSESFMNPSGTLTSALGNISERLGAFDNTVDLISYGHQYSAVINLNYYYKSIVDGLIPGSITGIETLRASVMLRMFYMPGVDREHLEKYYHSDVFTVFAENFLLFGFWGGLLGLFLIGAFVSLVFRTVSFRLINPVALLFATSTLLYLWWSSFLQGFGLDTLVLDSAKIGVTCLAACVYWNLAIAVMGSKNDGVSGQQRSG